METIKGVGAFVNTAINKQKEREEGKQAGFKKDFPFEIKKKGDQSNEGKIGKIVG